MTAGVTSTPSSSAPPPCALCDADDWGLVFSQLHDVFSHATDESFDLWRCGGCGAGRTWPIAQDTTGYYPDTYGLHADAGLRGELGWQARFAAFAVARSLSSVAIFSALAARSLRRYGGETWHELERYAPGRHFALLDVGCGSGSFPRNLRRLGIDAVGVEPSDTAAEAARRIGVPCHSGTIETAPYPAEWFDVVRFCHVLEHTADPVADLADAHRLLRPDGRVVVRVPAWDSLQADLLGRSWRPLDIPRHLWHFTRSALEGALARAGFTDASWEGLCQDWVYISLMAELQEEGHAPREVNRALAAERAMVTRLGADLIAAGDVTEWFVVARRV